MNLMLAWLSDIFYDQWRWVVSAAVMAIILPSCNSSKYMAEDQSLLQSQRVELLNAKQVDNRGDLTYELSTLARQQPNGNFLFLFPREYFYLANSKPRDTTGLDRFLRNTLGQVPAFYSDSLSALSAESMQTYLRYQGYFNAQVYHEPDRKKKRVALTYYADPGRRTVVNSLNYNSSQPDIDSLLQLAEQNSLIKIGDPLDLNVYNQEKEHISLFLRNQGYAFLYNNAFDQLEVDTFQQPGLADLYLKVLPQRDGSDHVRYRIGRVEVYPDYSLTDRSGDLIQRDDIGIDTIVDGVRFIYRDAKANVEPDVLLDNLFIRPGEYYSKDDFDKSNRQLGGLGIFRFVRINQVVDSTDANILHYVVQLTPNFKMEFGTNFDVSYTNRGNSGANSLIGIGGNLIGFSLNPSYRNRNLLGGAQLLILNLNAGVEVNPQVNSSNNLFWNTVDLGADASLYLPRFRDAFGIYRLLYGKGKRVLTDRFYNAMREQASTRFGLGFEYLLIRGFYSFTQANARFGYDFNVSPTTRYQINHSALDLLTPRTEPEFDTILDSNEFLRRSFGEQFFVSLFFRDIDYLRTGKPGLRGQSVTFNANFEATGWELFGVNKLVNALSNNDTKFSPGGNADFAQYLRLRLDTRYYQKYNELNSFASRLVLGVARPFGFGTTVPYVKQFSVGGANSMRAWAPRGLGPGGYLDSLSLEQGTRSNLLLYQTGDLMLELNLEYRYKLFWQLKGAFFLDIGNIWSLDADDERCGSYFRFGRDSYPCGGTTFFHQPFYRQIAIGGGTGIRVDLSYFIFRLDVSVPLRNNYPRERPEGVANIPERLYWNNFSNFRFPSSLTWQLGLGYPF